MGTVASKITSLTIVYSTVYSDANQRKYQSSASLAFVQGIHRRSVISPHKWPVTRKMFPFDDVIMVWNSVLASECQHNFGNSIRLQSTIQSERSANILSIDTSLWQRQTFWGHCDRSLPLLQLGLHCRLLRVEMSWNNAKHRRYPDSWSN